jgi:hypothetical protein
MDMLSLDSYATTAGTGSKVSIANLARSFKQKAKDLTAARRNKLFGSGKNKTTGFGGIGLRPAEVKFIKKLFSRGVDPEKVIRDSLLVEKLIMNSNILTGEMLLKNSKAYDTGRLLRSYIPLTSAGYKVRFGKGPITGLPASRRIALVGSTKHTVKSNLKNKKRQAMLNKFAMKAKINAMKGLRSTRDYVSSTTNSSFTLRSKLPLEYLGFNKQEGIPKMHWSTVVRGLTKALETTALKSKTYFDSFVSNRFSKVIVKAARLALKELTNIR